MRMFVAVIVAIAALGGGGLWYWHVASKPQIEYRTAKIKRGDLIATIGASGTIEPQEVIDVGAQVTGPITTFGKDSNKHQVDYTSVVEENAVLATIDETTYKADRDTANAQLDQAKAARLKAKADLLQTDALVHQAEANWMRAQKVGPSDALSQNDYDMYKANYGTATANVGVSEAEVKVADAGVVQAQAALDKAQRNLDFCTIKSPVKGVVIDRRVNVGQTVVGSLAPASMFLIATDLTKMQIWVAVNEADIGHIFPGQNVTFTCDALQNLTFFGKVQKIRLNATMTQNVVTYTVEVSCDNPDLKLLPYMTANVEFELQKDSNVLIVPNAALRWYPSEKEEVVVDARSQWKPIDNDERDKPNMGDMPAPPKKDKNGKPVKSKKPDRFGTVWIKDGQFVRPLKVKIGTSDGIDTEVSAENLGEGPEVVVGEIVQAAGDGQERNPFLPQMRRR
jgi:HlyD family secretion protein